jgi:hypothetical protein
MAALIRLRRRQLQGHKFRRQVPIGPYFADFACLDARLVVEVDGDHHGDQLVYTPGEITGWTSWAFACSGSGWPRSMRTSKASLRPLPMP